MSSSIKPFDFLNDINYRKEDIMDEENESSYPPYLINKGLSYFVDTCIQANDVNRYHHLDHRLQFDYLLNSVRSKKRFSKWAKPEKVEALEMIKEYYGYNMDKAKDVLYILNDDHINEIKVKLDKGGAK